MAVQKVSKAEYDLVFPPGLLCFIVYALSV